MNDPIIVMDREGLEALPAGAQVQAGGRTYVRTENGFQAAYSTPEFTVNYIASKGRPMTVLNPEILGPFVAVGDTVQIMQRFFDGRASSYNGTTAKLVRINRGHGQPYTVAVGQTGYHITVKEIAAIEQTPEPLTESLAELLPFYVKDAKVLDELPHGSVVTVLHAGFYPRSNIHGAWRLPPLEDDYTSETKGLVAEHGALVVSVGAEEFLPEQPRFW
ncbi:hypothetical protein [Kribbella sindirgiensis]|uniref:Uncharacterized protein n=1 Tax=Kribbella sindirgiensis TaxID=1124744 RepID=A0A4R0I366_9ACTN|nr:hypothetical protein [Kribbella sindirgiensis]TCC19931.1 hypothetical protein E0H50_37510 [Kribbella sindirgiensis]